MKDLLFYIVDQLLNMGKITKCEDKICSEECFQFCIEPDCILMIFTRSELVMLNDLMLERIAAMSDRQVSVWKNSISKVL